MKSPVPTGHHFLYWVAVGVAMAFLSSALLRALGWYDPIGFIVPGMKQERKKIA